MSLGRTVLNSTLLLLAFFLFVSLASYHPYDPNLLSKGGVGGGYVNLCGFVGANLAGLPMALAGLGAWLLPIYVCWEALSRPGPNWQRRVAWFILALSAWTLLGAADMVAWPPGGGGSQIRCGGWVGYALWPALSKVLGPVGLPLTLGFAIAISCMVLAPRMARALGKRVSGWFGGGLRRSAAALAGKTVSAIGMARRLAIFPKRGKSSSMPELSVADGRDLQILDENQQAVDALEKAEREAAEFRRSSNRTHWDAGLPEIFSVKLPPLQQEEEAPPRPPVPEPTPQGDWDGAVLSAPRTPKPAPVPLPRPGALKDLPPPPTPKPPLVKPKIYVDPSGRSVEQPDLGFTEPTPNRPLPEMPETPGPAERLDLPPCSLFDPPEAAPRINTQSLEDTKELIQLKLTEFKVKGRIVGMQPGPVVTVYEFSPDPGVPLSKVMGMEEDLALGLKAEKVRIDRISGRNVVGIEVPNAHRETITFSQVLESPEFMGAGQKGGRGLLCLALGKDMGGRPVVADLARMPHLLIGGSTGSGKSVGVNAMICSILFRARADEVKLIMIDPKMVELGVYEDIPHLWAPVVTDMKEAGRILKWVVAQMEERYRLLSLLSVRDLEQFNAKVIEAGGDIDISDRTPNPKWPDRPHILERLPYVVVIIDELADLMMVCRTEVEESIARIAQKARAVGIHLILATQRPSVDIVTGVIKANLPARLSYLVKSKIDSRTILDSSGGEQLLGMGDALYLAPGTSRLRRIHGPRVTEEEIAGLVRWLKERGRPDYNLALIQAMEADEGNGRQSAGDLGAGDDVYDRAVAIVTRERKASTSLLQRKLNIGYGRAARLIDRMEDEGLVGPDRGAGKPREVFGEDGR